MKVPNKVPIYIGKNTMAKAYSNSKHFSKWVTDNKPYTFDFTNTPFFGRIINGRLAIQVSGLWASLELSKQTLDDVIEYVGINPGGAVDCNFIFITIAGHFDIVREGSELHKRCLLQKVKVFEEGKVYCNEKGEYLYFGKYFTRDINEKIIQVNVFKEISNKAPEFVMFKKPSLYETGESKTIYKEELSFHILKCQDMFYKKQTFGYDITKENLYEKIFGKSLQFAMLGGTTNSDFFQHLKKIPVSFAKNTPYNIAMLTTTNVKMNFDFVDYFKKMVYDQYQLPQGIFNTGYLKGF
jgi:hypothetical protein